MRDARIILGVPIDNLNMQDAIREISNMMEGYAQDERARQVVTVNVDFLINALSWWWKKTRHPELLEILRRADLLTADGMPIVWMSRLLGSPLKGRVTGADLVPELAREAARLDKSIYFLGGCSGMAEQASRIMAMRHPGLRVAGFSSPFVYTEGQSLADFKENDKIIVDIINRSGADILLIALGNPKQEIWFERNRDILKVPVSIGVGGTFEFICGRTKRAPEWMQKTGFEWIFRIIQDPIRLFKRYFVGFFKFTFMLFPAIVYYRYSTFSFREISKERLPYSFHPVDIPLLDGGYTRLVTLPVHLDEQAKQSIVDEGLEKIFDCQSLVLDFSEVSSIDAVGLSLIMLLWKEAIDKNRLLYLSSINPRVRHFMELNRTWDLLGKHLSEDISRLPAMPGGGVIPHLFYSVLEVEKNYATIRLFGRLDAARMRDLDIDAILKKIGGRNCIINMNHLSFVDSSGLSFFLKVQKAVTREGGKCLLCELHNNVKQVFSLAKLDNFFQIEKDISSSRKFLGVPVQ